MGCGASLLKVSMSLVHRSPRQCLCVPDVPRQFRSKTRVPRKRHYGPESNATGVCRGLSGGLACRADAWILNHPTFKRVVKGDQP
jgi:hypothetical protein